MGDRDAVVVDVSQQLPEELFPAARPGADPARTHDVVGTSHSLTLLAAITRKAQYG